jgi:ElaB/YqjD/DUF883 family membrane-anchored ribosome-binding protein
MATDVLVSRELKSLQEELSTSRKERASPASSSTGHPSVPEPRTEPSAELELQDQLRQFATELNNLFEGAEKGISEHPTQSVIGALLVGILVGRLLGRR